MIGRNGSLFEPALTSDVNRFTATMTNLLESNVVARTVIDDLGLRISPERLLKRLHVSSRPDSSVLEVSYLGLAPGTRGRLRRHCPRLQLPPRRGARDHRARPARAPRRRERGAQAGRCALSQPAGGHEPGVAVRRAHRGRPAVVSPRGRGLSVGPGGATRQGSSWPRGGSRPASTTRRSIASVRTPRSRSESRFLSRKTWRRAC